MIDQLDAFSAHCDYYSEKLKLLNTVYEGINCENCALLEHWDLYAKNVDEACNFLDQLAWDTYEFQTSCFNSYIPPLCIPNYTPCICKIYHYSAHDGNSYPYYISTDDCVELTT